MPTQIRWLYSLLLQILCQHNGKQPGIGAIDVTQNQHREMKRQPATVISHPRLAPSGVTSEQFFRQSRIITGVSAPDGGHKYRADFKSLC